MQLSDLRAARDKVPTDVFSVIDPQGADKVYALMHSGLPGGRILIGSAELKHLQSLAGREIRIVRNSRRAFEFTLVR